MAVGDTVVCGDAATVELPVVSHPTELVGVAVVA